MLIEYEAFRTDNPDYFFQEKQKNPNAITHFHSCFEYLYCVSGKMDVKINGKNFIINQGEAILIFPYQIHSNHNITQSMSRKGNCLDNSVMENFFGRLKVEMFYGETFRTTDEFIRCLEEYITYYNNERISLKLKMSPAQYRTQSQII